MLDFINKKTAEIERALNPKVSSKPQPRDPVTAFLEGGINKISSTVNPALNNFFAGITPEPIQQYGREQEKKGWGGALETASYLFGPPGIGNIVTPILGSLVAPLIPNSRAAAPTGLKPKPPLEKPLPQVIPGTAIGNMGALYEQGQKAAKTQEEMNQVRDLGLALHAQKYGTPGQRMASTIGARNPLLDSMGLQQPSRPEVFVENPTDAFLQSEVDKKGKEVQDFLKTFNASRSAK